MYALPHGADPMAATIGECGAMNLFFVFDCAPAPAAGGSGSSGSGSGSGSSGGGAGQQRQLEVVTPPLDGTILPGITRASVLELLARCVARGAGAVVARLPTHAACVLHKVDAHAAAAAAAVAWRRLPGVRVSERQLTVGEIVSAHERGALLEVFGTGTACVVQPVGAVVLGARGGRGDRELLLPPAAAAAAGGGSGGSGGSGGWAPQGAPSVAEWARATLTDIQYGKVPGHPWCVAVE
jgi:hypothetical protein